jgi:hypothetical protein
VSSGVARPGLGRSVSRAGYTQPDRLAAVSKADFNALHDIGPTEIELMRAALESHRLAFGN